MCGLFVSLYSASADDELQKNSTDDPAGDTKFSGGGKRTCRGHVFRVSVTGKLKRRAVLTSQSTENRTERPFKGGTRVCVPN